MVAGVRDEENPEILGVGLAPSTGLNRGAVVDLEATTKAIEEAARTAFSMSGLNNRRSIVGIAGSFIRSYNSRGSVVVASPGRGVTPQDVRAAVGDAVQKQVPSEMEVIHALAREYRLDDVVGIDDPTNMHGSLLEVDLHLVSGSRAALRNVRRAASNAGLRIEGLALQPLASSLAVLEESEKSAGVAMIDIGGGTTDVAVFLDGLIRHSEVILIGGDYITKDISKAFVTPFDQAEDLKIRYGGAISEGISPSEQIEVSRAKKTQPVLVQRRRLNYVIEARIEQIFDEVKTSLEENDFLTKIRGGLVLTGGTANLEGIREKASAWFKLPAEIGFPNGVSGYSEIVRNPIYATAIGLIHHGIAERKKRRSGRLSWRRPWDWAKRTIRDTF